MPIVPYKQLAKHKKIISIIVVVFFLCSFHSSFFHQTPVTEDGENIETTTDSILPAQVLPRIHDMFKPKIAEAPQCEFADGANISAINYVPDVTYYSLLTSELAVFRNFTNRVRTVTQEANNLLRRRVLVKRPKGVSQDDPYARFSKVNANSRLGVNMNGYLYLPGGHWIPTTCKAKWKVAIVIPFRDRFDNLHILLRNLVPFLLNQKLEFGIFVAEQGFSEVMNRGAMRNVGFQLASYDGSGWDCYIFHDVDYIPMNVTNYYGCEDFPKHYAINLEEFQYGNPYLADFGGVVGVTQEQVDLTNGYSNMYWGWGGEDDDIYKRLSERNFNVTRSDEGYYRTLKHKKKSKRDQCRERFCLVKHAAERMETDGLSSIRYPNGANITLSTLYTKISVDIQKEDWNYGFLKCHIRRKENYKIALFFVFFYVGVILLAATGALVSLVMYNPEKDNGDYSKGERGVIPYRRKPSERV